MTPIQYRTGISSHRQNQVISHRTFEPELRNWQVPAGNFRIDQNSKMTYENDDLCIRSPENLRDICLHQKEGTRLQIICEIKETIRHSGLTLLSQWRGLLLYVNLDCGLLWYLFWEVRGPSIIVRNRWVNLLSRVGWHDRISVFV